ncbi:MAG: tetratricopeptide repeat protein [Pirellulales bacterium]|nr:tetratricopeptide repeat protein [Pirellulales bacterium]
MMRGTQTVLKPPSVTYVNRFWSVGWSAVPLWFAALVVLPLCGCGSFAARGLNAEGVRKFEQAQYDESLGQFQKAIANDPSNPDAYYNVGAVYHRLATLNNRKSDYEQAEYYYNQCLDREADHAECHRGLAVMLVQQGRSEQAFRLLQGWADRRADLAEPKIELARLHEELGDRSAAKERLVEALAVNPNNPRARAALGHLQEGMGEYAQALANYQQSLWQDQFQPDVAARIASLQAGLPTPTTVTVEGPSSSTTRMASRGTGTLR